MNETSDKPDDLQFCAPEALHGSQRVGAAARMKGIMHGGSTRTGTELMTETERLFGGYLDESGIAWEYERPHGSKAPDFTIVAKNQMIAVVEIKETEWSRNEKQQWRAHFGAPSNPPPTPGCRAIRAKIRRARTQLDGVDDLPCMLVLRDPTGIKILDGPVHVFAAMLDDERIVVPISKETGMAIGPEQPAFGPGGKMRDPHARTERNTKISAIGFFSEKSFDLKRWGYEHRYDKACRALENQRSSEFPDYLRVAEELVEQARREGFDPDLRAWCLDVYRNPSAAVQWPDNLAGIRGTVWGWEQTGTISIV